MNPHYYLMKNKKILRLEADMTFETLSFTIQDRAFLPGEQIKMTQDQANWRVVLFRDEIMELPEFEEWLVTPQAMEEEVFEYELAAN